ncbi:HEPN/Toprim-associated domain-containing protein [Paenibacillus sp. IHBB 10380]|uniref:HEPN/Toprim-associated domain-containing protein n=1 Tax=Paenibacillus sp. IHBB 10380 TaxID=1566358 RepID=UPI0005CFCFC6|nr:HEPN/Toprim-associated domain-containing protein [Paenibacillus sp. IHBB 10380]AJS58193.1 hypothetical protein UB51_06410 [Paenibacillus sp. IHBB 10380]
MGSYCGLTINGVGLFSVKNTFSETHLKLFSPLEFIKYKEDLDGEDYERYVFRTTVKKAMTRLEILGCSNKKLITYFNNGLEYQKSYYAKPDDEYDKRYEYYERLTFDNYSNALRSILESESIDIYDDNIKNKHPKISTDIISRLIVEKLSSGNLLNPFFYDDIYENEEHLIDHMLDIYMCIINCNEDSVVEYDLSSVVDGGWVDESDALEFFDNFMDTTIIVTEGKTDIKVLSRSLEILYPEYNHLYTFFDFYNYRADGGTSYLAKLLKSFSAAKIKNRIIAIFDNDAAAELEIQSLSTIPILESIKIMKLPILDFCTSYPTIGPTGRNNININGLAVSIELFFGEDILKSNNEFSPIQWTNYVEKLDMYQGSIINKSEINVKLDDKLKNPDLINQDWSKLTFLWDTIFKQSF